MGKIYKKGAAVFTALSLTACGANTTPNSRTTPSHSESHVTLAQIDCPVFVPIDGEITYHTPELTTQVWKDGMRSMIATCIEVNSLNIVVPSQVRVSSYTSKEFKSISTNGAYVLSLAAECFRTHYLKTQLVDVPISKAKNMPGCDEPLRFKPLSEYLTNSKIG